MLAQELVTRASALAFLPNTTAFSAAAILGEINLAMRMMLAPALVRVNGEYFTETLDVTPDASGYVRLPQTALSTTARLVNWIYSDGSEGDPLMQVSLTDIASIQNIEGSTVNYGGVNYPVSSGTPYAFTPLPDGIQLYSVPQNGNCRIRYSRLPAPLILGAAGTLVPPTTAVVWNTTGVPTQSTGNWIVATTPAQGTGNPAVNTPIDLIDFNSPYRMTITGTADGSGNVILGAIGVVDTVAARITAGFFACATYNSPVPQCPVEWHDYLLYCAAARLAGLRKDPNLKADLLNDAKSLQMELTNIAQPRFKQNVKSISAWRGHTQRPWRLG